MKHGTFRAITAGVFFVLSITAFCCVEKNIGWYSLIIANIWSCSITLKSVDD